MYLERYKANIDIFNDIPEIEFGALKLRSILPSLIDVEAKAYLDNSNDILVKKHLPNAYVETEQQAMDKLEELTKLFLFKQGFLYVIAVTQTNVPIGYVICNSPLQTFTNDSKKTLNDWTINFWLSEKVRGMKLAAPAVNNALKYLNSMQVPRVHAYVDASNARSIKVLQKCRMTQVTNTTVRDMLKFEITF